MRQSRFLNDILRLAELTKRLRSANRGSISMVAALSFIPVFGLAGAAIDYSRTNDVRSRIQNAADAAVIAAAKTTGTPAERKNIGEKVFYTNVSELSNVTLNQTLTETTNGVRLEVTASNLNYYMGLIGRNTSPIRVISEAIVAPSSSAGSTSTTRVEIALALDTTGSMKDDMNSLRSSAVALTNKVMTGSNVYVSVVPYVASVNVGTSNLPMSMMDTGVNSRWHGQNFNSISSAIMKNCGYPAVSYPSWPGGGPGAGDIEGSNGLRHRFAMITKELFGIKALKAQVTPNTTHPFSYSGTAVSQYNSSITAPIVSGFSYWGYGNYWCAMQNPAKVSHFDLFNRIPGAAWKGCVEARPEPYDVSDEAPNGGNADTLFVPYFWPDEPDVSSYTTASSNNYIPDFNATKWPDGWNSALTTNLNIWSAVEIANSSILKYNNIGPASIQNSPPATQGPNKACPDELLRLNNNKANVQNKINSLSHWSSGGTIASEGLTWAWRTISPKAPFNDGMQYTQSDKYIVLMGDGVNEFSANLALKAGAVFPALYSDYTAYGYLKKLTNYMDLGSFIGRIPASTSGDVTFTDARNYFDQRFLQACTNAKNAGVKIYTVLFREASTTATNNYRACATDPTKAFKAANQAELLNAFNSIGDGIASSTGQSTILRISK